MTQARSLQEFLKNPNNLKNNQTITELYLNRSQIGDSVVNSLGEALAKNQTLTYLSLAHNQIGDAGKIAIGRALICNKSLKEISFEDNNRNDIEKIIRMAQEWLLSKRDNIVKSAHFVAEQKNDENNSNIERPTKVNKLLEGGDISDGQCSLDSNDGKPCLSGDNADQQ